MRPGEVHKIRWEHIVLDKDKGIINILDGKSKAARRKLPMVPIVHETLKRRYKDQGHPTEGWVFPAKTKSGHTEEDGMKRSHRAALKDSKIKPFPPYCMRHTALTDLATLGCDAFTLARIAGHSSITITQRYCHPQADAIERAFGIFSAKEPNLVTEGGQRENV